MNNSKFKENKLVFITVCFSFVFAILSCSEIAQKIDGGGQDTSESEQEFIITGTLSVDVNGALPSEVAKSVYGGSSSLGLENSARSAVPSEVAENNPASSDKNAARTAFPNELTSPTSITYRVTAEPTSGGPTVQGEVNGNSFTIRLSSGTWTINAEGFSDPSMSEDKKILKGSSGQFTLDANSVKNDIAITLSPLNSGNGTIDLAVDFDSTTDINSMEMTLTKNGSTSPILITGTGSTPVRLTKTDIAAGTYNAEIKFKSSSGELKYSVKEVIIVLPNLTTNTWQGNSPYLSGAGTSKTFFVTQALVDGFNKNIDDKIFYVAGTDSSFSVTADDSDDNAGTNPFRPFATLQKAVDKVIAINDGTSAYTIKVDGTLEITTPAPPSSPEESNDNSGVNIAPDNNLNLTIEGTNTSKKATIKAKTSDSNYMRVFRIIGKYASENKPSVTPNITMKNLIITEGISSTGSGGGGIYVYNGDLTLSNVEVTKNYAKSGRGGGIFFYGGSLTLNENTKIINNTADSIGGGGIYVESGNLDITDSEISKNKAFSGGGIYLQSENFNNIVTITGNTNISENKLEYGTDGTAIYVRQGVTVDIRENVRITPAQGDTNSIIYLEHGSRISGRLESPDAVLKLGGAVQIDSGNGTGIKIDGKYDRTKKANIKITSELTGTTQLFNIRYDGANTQEPIIEGDNNGPLTQDDCDKFRVISGNSTYTLVKNGTQGIRSVQTVQP